VNKHNTKIIIRVKQRRTENSTTKDTKDNKPDPIELLQGFKKPKGKWARAWFDRHYKKVK